MQMTSKLKNHIKSSQPFQDGDVCKECPFGVDIYADPETLSLELLNMYRSTCSVCKQGGGDVAPYKYDLNNRASRAERKVKEFKPYRGGKGETYFKKYAESIRNLRAEGKTQKQISTILGISISSVNKICKKL